MKKGGVLGAFKNAVMNSYTNIDGLPKEIIKNKYNQSNGKTGLSKMLPIVVMVATLGKSIKSYFHTFVFFILLLCKTVNYKLLNNDQVLFA